MGKFEDRLLSDLLTEHRPALDAVEVPAPRRAGHRPLWIAASVLGLTGAVTVGAVLIGGGSPAYAVTKDADGTVSVTLRESSGMDGANDELRELGVPAKVVPVRPECPSVDTLPVVQPQGKVTGKATTNADGSISFETTGVPDGATVVVTSEEDAAGKLTLGMFLVDGPAPDCVSPPSGPGGSTQEGTGPDAGLDSSGG
jgi:hypothetical protein